MAWLDRYLNLFEGEPVWLVLLVSTILLVGVIVIVEKMVKIGIWLLIVGLVAAMVIAAGVYFFL
jgi:hypothetical protein